MSLTAAQIRKANEQERLLEGLRASPHAHLLDEYQPERTPRGVKVGPIEVMPGLDPDRPVLRDARTKRAVEGTGKHLPKPPPSTQAVVAPQYRDKVEYREAFEKLFPAGGDIDERGSLAWWFDKAWLAAEGSPQFVDCPHPEAHIDKKDGPLKHVTAFKLEASLIFKMVELAVGKATQTVNVNAREEKITKALEYRVFDVTLHGISDFEANERKALIENFGYSTEMGEIQDIVIPAPLVAVE